MSESDWHPTSHRVRHDARRDRKSVRVNVGIGLVLQLRLLEKLFPTLIPYDVEAVNSVHASFIQVRTLEKLARLRRKPDVRVHVKNPTVTIQNGQAVVDGRALAELSRRRLETFARDTVNVIELAELARLSVFRRRHDDAAVENVLLCGSVQRRKSLYESQTMTHSILNFRSCSRTGEQGSCLWYIGPHDLTGMPRCLRLLLRRKY